MARVTLRELFQELDGREYATRKQFEKAFLKVFNRCVTQLPVGYSYMDAIDGARAEGWLHTNGHGHGVKVCMEERLARV